jgi:hypothetical protein
VKKERRRMKAKKGYKKLSSPYSKEAFSLCRALLRRYSEIGEQE